MTISIIRKTSKAILSAINMIKTNMRWDWVSHLPFPDPSHYYTGRKTDKSFSKFSYTIEGHCCLYNSLPDPAGIVYLHRIHLVYPRTENVNKWIFPKNGLCYMACSVTLFLQPFLLSVFWEKVMYRLDYHSSVH